MRAVVSLVFGILICLAPSASFGQFGIKNTPLDTKTWTPPKNPLSNTPADPNTWRIPVRPDSGSSVGYTWTTYYSIQADGSVIQQTVGASESRSQVKWTKSNNRAKLEHNNKGQAYFVYAGAENNPRRASQFDKQIVQKPIPKLVLDIDPNTGDVYELTIVENKTVGSRVIGKANLQRNQQGFQTLYYPSAAPKVVTTAFLQRFGVQP